LISEIKVQGFVIVILLLESTGFSGNSRMAEQGIVLKSHVTVLEMCQEHSVHSTPRLLLLSCCFFCPYL